MWSTSVVGVVGRVFLEGLDDPAPRLVGLGLATAVRLADGLGRAGLEAVLERLAADVDRLAELLYDLC